MRRKRDIYRQYLASLNSFEIVKLAVDSKLPVKWKCAIAYFWMIFLFGFIYTVLPAGDFYYANAARELTLNEDTVREDSVSIGRELGQEMVKAFREGHGGDQTQIDKWLIDVNAIKVLSLSATNKGNDVEITVKLETKLIHTSDSRRLFLDPTVTFYAKGFEMGPDKKIHRTVTVSIPEGLPEEPFVRKEWPATLTKALFPTPKSIAAQSEGEQDALPSLPKAIIPIAEPLNARILILAKGLQGDPTYLSGNLQRMLYLSAATITTMGANDISPLTTRARMLLTLEVVIGIILIGLFLNALVAEATKK